MVYFTFFRQPQFYVIAILGGVIGAGAVVGSAWLGWFASAEWSTALVVGRVAMSLGVLAVAFALLGTWAVLLRAQILHQRLLRRCMELTQDAVRGMPVMVGEFRVTVLSGPRHYQVSSESVASSAEMRHDYVVHWKYFTVDTPYARFVVRHGVRGARAMRRSMNYLYANIELEELLERMKNE